MKLLAGRWSAVEKRGRFVFNCCYMSAWGFWFGCKVAFVSEVHQLLCKSARCSNANISLEISRSRVRSPSLEVAIFVFVKVRVSERYSPEPWRSPRRRHSYDIVCLHRHIYFHPNISLSNVQQLSLSSDRGTANLCFVTELYSTPIGICPK